MQVFLSYADSDLTLAQKIAGDLQSAGFQVWYDDVFVLPGDNWGSVVGDALNQSDAMIALLTSDGLRSKKVSSETQFALGHKGYAGRLIPVVVEEESVKEKIPWIYHHLNPITLRTSDLDAGIHKIIEALTNDIDPRFQIGESAS